MGACLIFSLFFFLSIFHGNTKPNSLWILALKQKIFSRNVDFPWYMRTKFLEPQPLILGGFRCCNYLKQSLWLWGLNFIGIMFCGFKGKALQKLIMTIILENFENQHICKIKTQWNAKISWMSQIHSNLPSLSFFKFNFDYWKH